MPEQNQHVSEQLAVAEQERKAAEHRDFTAEFIKLGSYAGGFVGTVFELSGGDYANAGKVAVGAFVVGVFAGHRQRKVTGPNHREHIENVESLKAEMKGISA